MTDHKLPAGGLVEALGIVLSEVSEDRVVGTLDAGPVHQQPYGVVHGGTYCVMVETLASMGAALWAMERDIPAVVGVSNTTDFLRSHREGLIRGVATPIHRGRSQQLWAVEVTRDEDGKLLARGQVRLQNITDPAAIGV